MNQKMFYEATPLIFEQAKELRNNLTQAEIILWTYLRTRPHGYKFRRQHPIGPFIADFYCHSLKLVIEADGSIHDNKEVKQADRAKQWSIEKEGVRVIHFTNQAIINQFKEVVATINEILLKDAATNPTARARGLGGKTHIEKINIILTEQLIPPSGG
jgi:imidazole glycerol-phosphate synthase subunit HisF